MAYKTPNPVQKIQGFVETGSESVTTSKREIVRVPTTLPLATVQLFLAGTNLHGRFYNGDGEDLEVDSINADVNGFYSFFAETGRYTLKFFDPVNSKEEVAPAKELKIESRTFNVHDYGARGDGMSDDTVAIQAALKAMMDANPSNEVVGVGTLFFPSGRYMVSRQVFPSYHIFDLPSGLIIQGTAGPYSGIGKSNCQIVLTSPDCRLFHIGTSRHKIIFRDIAVTTEVENNADTIAVDLRASEDVATTFSSGIEFENVTIWNFDRGISIEGSNTVTKLEWDITGVRINHCNITECQYSIYVNSQNCSFMRILDTRIGAINGGFGIYMERVGIITIDSILGAGQPTHEAPSDTFIYITKVRGTVTIINCECEGFSYSVRVEPPEFGNISWPILLLNCAFGPKVLINSQCDIVSVGTRYLPGTFECSAGAQDAMIFSFGDVIIGLDKVPREEIDFEINNDSSRMARANRYRVDFQRPTRIGGAGGQPARNQQVIEHNPALAVAPFDSDGTQITLCNPAGDKLFNLRADSDNIYFEDARTKAGTKLMSLDVNGNLTVKGDVISNSEPKSPHK